MGGFVDVKGDVLLWENWRNGEPNNQNGNEDCVELHTSNIWNDIPCSVEKEAICQKTKVDVVINRQVVFEKSFTTPPNVILSVTKINAYPNANLRYDVKAVDVTTDGFRIKMTTWDNSHLPGPGGLAGRARYLIIIVIFPPILRFI